MLLPHLVLMRVGAAPTGTNTIPPNDFHALLQSGDVQLIDVRNTDEFLAKHIDGARNIPLLILDKGQIYNFDKKIVLQCKSGARTSQAVQKLNHLYPEIELLVLEGGIKSWEAAGYKIVQGKNYTNYNEADANCCWAYNYNWCNSYIVCFKIILDNTCLCRYGPNLCRNIGLVWHGKAFSFNVMEFSRLILPSSQI